MYRAPCARTGERPVTDPTDLPDSGSGSPVLAGLTVLSGPAAAGTSAVVQAIRRHCPAIWHCVAVTTREPRPGEIHGSGHSFVTCGEFEELAVAGELIEWARYAGHQHGTPRGPVADRLKSGVPVLLDIDLAGVGQVRAAIPEALLVYLAPPPERGLGSPSRTREPQPSDFDITVVNTSVEDASAQLVALMTGQPASQPAR